jgi:hypothetical protein
VGGNVVDHRYLLNDTTAASLWNAHAIGRRVLEKSGKSRELRRYMHEDFFGLDEQWLDLVVNRVPNRKPQQRDPCDKRPPPRTDGRLRVECDQGQALMLEQEPARSILEDVTPADPRYAQLAGLIR